MKTMPYAWIIGAMALMFEGSAGAAPEELPLRVAVAPGVTFPICSGQPEECDAGSMSVAPSFRLWALYPPSPAWGIGLVGQVAFAHWTAYQGLSLSTGEPQYMKYAFTTFFTGLGGRFALAPDWRVKPTLELGLGVAFQFQSKDELSCGGGAAPSALLGLGVDAPLTSSMSLLVSASAISGVSPSQCDVSDGVSPPFVAWGYGLHAGLAFDIAGSSQSAAPSTAAR